MAARVHQQTHRARLVLPNAVSAGTLHVVDGLIADIDIERELDPGDLLDGVVSRGTDPARTSDAGIGIRVREEDLLIPGLVELHTDNLERHLIPRPAVHWPDPLAAAVTHDAEVAAAGITTVFDSLRIGRNQGEDDQHSQLVTTVLDAMTHGSAHGAFRVDHRIHLRCELTDPQLMSTLEPYVPAHDIQLVSLMDHTPGQRQWRDIDALRRYQSRQHNTIEEREVLIGQRIELGHRYVPENRAAVIALFNGSGVSLASHDDTTLAHVNDSLRDGIGIAEFPCTLEAASAAHHAGMVTLGGAPNLVRGGSHSGNVAVAELVDAKVLGGLSSDYVPASLLQAVCTLVVEHGWHLPAAVALVTANTAAAVGLADRGELVVGKRADLVRVSLISGTPVVREVHVKGVRVL